MAYEDLGEFRGLFAVNRARRLVTFLVAVPLGVGFLYFCVRVGAHELARPHDGWVNPFVGWSGGFGLVALVDGLWQGWAYFTRRDEGFRLYEGGVVYGYRAKSWAIRWRDMVKVVDKGRGNIFSRMLGMDTCVRITLDPVIGRRTITITGMTGNAGYLAETVIRQASRFDVRPPPFRLR